MKTALVGLGLIGGSLGLALRAGRLVGELVGYDRNQPDLALALERGAIDRAAASAQEAVSGAELVILATPVMAIEELLGAIAAHLSPGALVTDVASTKALVLDWAERSMPPGVAFVGGHPMAGSERSGMAAARANLFRGAVYCVTPGASATEAQVACIERLAAGVGALPLRVQAAEHDAAVAAVSHLPFLTSTALVSLTAADPRWALWGEIAATGYRDVTRLASGDPTMYRDICLTNAEQIAPLLRGLAEKLLAIADQLDDRTALERLFTTARAQRDSWLQAHARFQLP